MASDIPDRVRDFLALAEDDSGLLASALFQRRFGDSIPAQPHHVVASYRGAGIEPEAACYVHFTRLGEILLGGGACVDNGVLRRMSAAQREAVHAAGGLYCLTLAWAVQHFTPHCAAIFGYCGDVRAERADLAVGFRKTAHEHLLVYWTGERDEQTRARLIAQAHALGPF